MTASESATRLGSLIDEAIEEADKQEMWLVGAHLSTARDALRGRVIVDFADLAPLPPPEDG